MLHGSSSFGDSVSEKALGSGKWSFIASYAINIPSVNVGVDD